MKLDIVAGSKNDENYTPLYAVEPIVKHLKPSFPKTVVWCPFDTEESWFVKRLRQEDGFEVVATHIDNGQDFFETQPPKDCRYVISNPPYSLKTEILERLFELKIPFAMLLGVVGLFESQRRFEMFRDNDFEVLYFNRRVSFFQDFTDEKPKLNPPFSSVYITHRIMPSRLNFEEIIKI